MASVSFTFLFYLTVLRSDVKVIKTKPRGCAVSYSGFAVQFYALWFFARDWGCFSCIRCWLRLPSMWFPSICSGVCWVLHSVLWICTGALNWDYYDIYLLLHQFLRITGPMICFHDLDGLWPIDPSNWLFIWLFIWTIIFSMTLSQKITSKKSVNSKKLSPFRCDIVSQLGAGFCRTC